MYKLEIFEERIEDGLDYFMKENVNSSFFQSGLWANFIVKFFKRKKFFVCVKDESNDILLYALIFKIKTPLGKSYFYSPLGPVFDFNKNKDIFSFFVQEIEKLCKKEKVIFFRCEPQINYKSVDRNVLQAHKDLYEFFIKKNGFSISKEIKQPENTLVLNLEKSVDEIFSNMKEKGRYNTRKAIKNDVVVIKTDDVNSIEFDTFYKLTEETTKRNNFYSNNKDYYKKLMMELKGNIFLYSAERKGKILASAIITFYGNKAIYFYGASTSSKEDRKLMAPYLLQFEIIKDAKKRGCELYDFLGVVPEIFEVDGDFYIFEGLQKIKFSSKKDAENYLSNHMFRGITDFKNKFNGETRNFIGAIDRVYDKKSYFILNLLKDLRRKIRRISGFKI